MLPARRPAASRRCPREAGPSGGTCPEPTRPGPARLGGRGAGGAPRRNPAAARPRGRTRTPPRRLRQRPPRAHPPRPPAALPLLPAQGRRPRLGSVRRGQPPAAAVRAPLPGRVAAPSAKAHLGQPRSVCRTLRRGAAKGARPLPPPPLPAPPSAPIPLPSAPLGCEPGSRPQSRAAAESGGAEGPRGLPSSTARGRGARACRPKKRPGRGSAEASAGQRAHSPAASPPRRRRKRRRGALSSWRPSPPRTGLRPATPLPGARVGLPKGAAAPQGPRGCPAPPAAAKCTVQVPTRDTFSSPFGPFSFPYHFFQTCHSPSLTKCFSKFCFSYKHSLL